MLVLDLETYLIGRRLTPRIVCITLDTGEGPYIVTRPTFDVAKEAIVAALTGGDLVGQNISYDLGCLCVEWPDLIPLVFDAYAAGRVKDTMIREKLKAIEDGTLDRRRFSLAALVQKYFSVSLGGKEGDVWRLKYSQLDGVPLEAWPSAATDYALGDVMWTRRVYEAQGGAIVDEGAQASAAWSLHLISVYGMRIDPHAAGAWLKQVEADVLAGEGVARGLGILRDNGTKNLSVLQELIKRAYKNGPPLTDTGRIKTDIPTLTESGDRSLIEYAETRFASKLSTTYAPILAASTVHPRYNVLVKSGRTSCSKPNMQNPPRSGGFRECFTPRPGWVYVFCDYDQIEMVALGQIHRWMFSTSAIADAVNDGRDLHLEVARHLNPDDPAAYRQFAKVANYGFAGGLAATTFTSYARGFGLDLSDKESKEIRAAWLKTWPEMYEYFRVISRETKWGPTTITQWVSDRKRGGCSYTQAANGGFSGLVADGAKAALFEVSRLCYTDKTSDLWGARPVAFLHDEIILEAREDTAGRAAAALEKTMIDTMKKYIPDVRVSAEAYLSRLWSKKAGPVRDSGGGLIPWSL